MLSPSAPERSALGEEPQALPGSCVHAWAGPEVARPSGRSSEGWTGPLPVELVSRGPLGLVTGQKPDYKELSGQKRGRQTNTPFPAPQAACTNPRTGLALSTCSSHGPQLQPQESTVQDPETKSLPSQGSQSGL